MGAGPPQDGQGAAAELLQADKQDHAKEDHPLQYVALTRFLYQPILLTFPVSTSKYVPPYSGGEGGRGGGGRVGRELKNSCGIIFQDFHQNLQRYNQVKSVLMLCWANWNVFRLHSLWRPSQNEACEDRHNFSLCIPVLAFHKKPSDVQGTICVRA